MKVPWKVAFFLIYGQLLWENFRHLTILGKGVKSPWIEAVCKEWWWNSISLIAPLQSGSWDLVISFFPYFGCVEWCQERWKKCLKVGKNVLVVMTVVWFGGQFLFAACWHYSGKEIINLLMIKILVEIFQSPYSCFLSMTGCVLWAASIVISLLDCVALLILFFL